MPLSLYIGACIRPRNHSYGSGAPAEQAPDLKPHDDHARKFRRQCSARQFHSTGRLDPSETLYVYPSSTANNRTFVGDFGFSNGWAELAFKKPRPLKRTSPWSRRLECRASVLIVLARPTPCFAGGRTLAVRGHLLSRIGAARPLSAQPLALSTTFIHATECQCQ
jgi:hypothetical protein